MNTEEQVVQEEQLAPLPSFTKLGLPRKFASLVADRLTASAKLGALKKIVEASTIDIKAAFVEKVLGIEDVDPTDKDSFSDLVAETAQTGESMCRVAQYKVGIVPGERSWIDDKLLKLAMLEAEIPLAMIDNIISAATKCTKWGEISIEEIAGKPRQVKGAKRGRKKLADPVPDLHTDRPKSKRKRLPAKTQRKMAKKR